MGSPSGVLPLENQAVDSILLSQVFQKFRARRSYPQARLEKPRLSVQYIHRRFVTNFRHQRGGGPVPGPNPAPQERRGHVAGLPGISGNVPRHVRRQSQGCLQPFRWQPQSQPRRRRRSHRVPRVHRPQRLSRFPLHLVGRPDQPFRQLVPQHNPPQHLLPGGPHQLPRPQRRRHGCRQYVRPSAIPVMGVHLIPVPQSPVDQGRVDQRCPRGEAHHRAFRRASRQVHKIHHPVGGRQHRTRQVAANPVVQRQVCHPPRFRRNILIAGGIHPVEDRFSRANLSHRASSPCPISNPPRLPALPAILLPNSNPINRGGRMTP